VTAGQTGRHRMTGMERREARAAYGFLAPAMALFVVFVLIPVVAAFYLSFTRYDIFHSPVWVGLANYQALVHDEVFHQSLANTAYYAAATILPAMALSLTLALILNSKVRGITFYRAAYYLPVVTSLVAVAMIWMWIYQPASGLLNQALAGVWEPFVQGVGRLLHIASLEAYKDPGRVWLGTPDGRSPIGDYPFSLTLRSIVAVALWAGLGWNMVIFLAGLQGIPPHLYESATLDGAGPWARFRNVTWPLLKPTTFFIFVTSVIGASQVFGTVYVMTNGGPNNTTTTIVHQIFQNAFSFLKMGYASAMAFVLFLIIVTVSAFNWKFFKGSDIEY
jgi:multiple sugar transport system permease protein